MGALTAAGSLVIGSGAFSKTEVERGIHVDVVGDPDAYLGIVYPSHGGEATPQPVAVESGERTNLFRAENQFTEEITTFEADIVNGADAFDDISLHESADDDVCIRTDEEDFEVGSCVQVEVAAECDHERTGEEEITVEIYAKGDGFDVTAQRTFVVNCEPVEPRAISWVGFCGLEEADVEDLEASETDDDGDPVEIAWETTEDVGLVVTKAGQAGTEGDSEPGMQNHHFDGERTGTVNAYGVEISADQTSDSPCPDGEDGVKFDWTGDGFEASE